MHPVPCCWTFSLFLIFHHEQSYNGQLCAASLVCIHDSFPQIGCKGEVLFWNGLALLEKGKQLFSEFMLTFPHLAAPFPCQAGIVNSDYRRRSQGLERLIMSPKVSHTSGRSRMRSYTCLSSIPYYMTPLCLTACKSRNSSQPSCQETREEARAEP